MLIKYDPKKINPLIVNSEAIPKINVFEIVACPNCHYNIPIHESYIDWETRYKNLEKTINEQYRAFDDVIEEMSNEIPEINLYLHNKKVKIIDLFNKVKALYNG